MTMTTVAGLRANPERRMQEKEVVGMFLTTSLHYLPLTRGIKGHAAFDGRSVKAKVIVNNHLITIHPLEM